MRGPRRSPRTSSNWTSACRWPHRLASRSSLTEDLFSGALFVFRNRRRTAVKLLVYDGQGFWLCQKRLSQGRFRFWPQESLGQVLAPHTLAVLLSGGDYVAAGGMPPWRAVV